MDVIEQIEALASRLSKARRAITEGKVRWNSSHTAVLVEGSTGTHQIRVKGLVIGKCDCPDYTFRRLDLSGWCWHRLAAKLFVKEAIDGHLAHSHFRGTVHSRDVVTGSRGGGKPVPVTPQAGREENR